MSEPDSWANYGIDLHLDLNAPQRGRAIEDGLRAAIREGRLAAGTRLPPSRGLAEDLGVARNTVAEAYGQLVAEGWLVARQGSGTRVADRARAQPRRSPPVAPSRAVRFDLTPGQPDTSTFPRTAWLSATRSALADAGAADLGYQDGLGTAQLRASLSAYLGRVRGVRSDPEAVIVCSGFGQGIAVIATALAARGARRVAVEAYSISRHRDHLARAGLEVVGVPVDDHGIDVGALEEADPDAVLVTPAHQFPLGVVLAPRRRDQLIAWATRASRWVIEDDYDGEFRFDRRPVGAIQALAPDRVVYAGTASKTLAPGLRLGWLVAPAGLVPDLAEVKEADPAQNSVLDQLTLARLIDSGHYDRHVRRCRLEYRRRRDRLVGLLAQEHPQLEVSGIAAGLHVVVSCPDGVSEAEMITRGRTHGVELQGLGEYGTGSQQRAPALVIGFGTPPPHAFTGAVARLSASLRGPGARTSASRATPRPRARPH